MKTNLIFKRQETVDGVTRVVTRIVAVDIPFINSGEGWTLSGHTDIIELMEPWNYAKEEVVQPLVETTIQTDTSDKESEEKKEPEDDIQKFNSDVNGTAKLVRSRGVIKIVARRGKSTYNQNTPNTVCIDDITKNNFFKDCRSFHGNTGVFQFAIKDGKPYDYWNNIIDKEYQRQKQIYLKNIHKEEN